MKYKRYLIIGGPGTGKSTLVNTLRDLQYPTVEEAARQIIRKNLTLNNKSLPWLDRDLFDQEVYNLMVADYEKSALNDITFFDGGLPDIIAWRKYLGKHTFNYEHISYKYKYEQIAFSPVPWKNLYYSDAIRPMNFAKAKEINDSIVDYYENTGYTVIKLYNYTPFERAQLVLEYLSNNVDS